MTAANGAPAPGAHLGGLAALPGMETVTVRIADLIAVLQAEQAQAEGVGAGTDGCRAASCGLLRRRAGAGADHARAPGMGTIRHGRPTTGFASTMGITERFPS